MSKLKICWNALKIVWKEKTFRIWLLICTIGIVLGLVASIGMTQLVLLVAIACMGWAMEVINTAVETMLDIVHPKHSEKVKNVKDLYAIVPAFVYSAYVICWLILVLPSLIERVGDAVS